MKTLKKKDLRNSCKLFIVPEKLINFNKSCGKNSAYSYQIYCILNKKFPLINNQILKLRSLTRFSIKYPFYRN